MLQVSIDCLPTGLISNMCSEEQACFTVKQHHGPFNIIVVVVIVIGNKDGHLESFPFPRTELLSIKRNELHHVQKAHQIIKRLVWLRSGSIVCQLSSRKPVRQPNILLSSGLNIYCVSMKENRSRVVRR